jgi:hypothetical protein
MYNSRWEVAEHNRLRMNARRRALQRLEAAHRDEFKRLLDEEMLDVPTITELRAQNDGPEEAT